MIDFLNRHTTLFFKKGGGGVKTFSKNPKTSHKLNFKKDEINLPTNPKLLIGSAGVFERNRI